MNLKQPQANHYNLRSGLTLYPSQQEAIEALLTHLLQQVPAHFILLSDVTGQPISARGEQNQTNLVALGSLMAGDLAASQEIARLTGQFEDHQMILREGQTTHTFITEAGNHLALLVQASTETPLGWVRMVIHKAALQLAEISTARPTKQEEETATSSEVALQDEDLSGLFDDALDDIWME